MISTIRKKLGDLLIDGCNYRRSVVIGFIGTKIRKQKLGVT